MSALTPITAGTEIAQAQATRLSKLDDASRQSLASETAQTLSQDSIEISLQAQERLAQVKQNEELTPNTSAVKVSSTSGQAKYAGNLSQEQATQLYQEIASLL